MGKSSYVAAAALLALGAIAIGLRDAGALIAIGVFVVVIFLIYFAGVLWFAHKHPGESLLEGSELIQWRQLEMAAKDLPQDVIENKSKPAVIAPSDGN